MIAVIVKPFTVAGAPLAGGALVDTTGWRNAATLMSGRHIRPATDAEAARYRAGDRSIRDQARAGATRAARPARSSTPKGKK